MIEALLLTAALSALVIYLRHDLSKSPVEPFDHSPYPTED